MLKHDEISYLRHSSCIAVNHDNVGKSLRCSVLRPILTDTAIIRTRVEVSIYLNVKLLYVINYPCPKGKRRFSQIAAKFMAWMSNSVEVMAWMISPTQNSGCECPNRNSAKMIQTYYENMQIGSKNTIVAWLVVSSNEQVSEKLRLTNLWSCERSHAGWRVGEAYQWSKQVWQKYHSACRHESFCMDDFDSTKSNIRI